MSHDEKRPRKSALLSFQFIGPAMIGSLTMALVAAFAPLPAQIAVLGTLVSILGGLFLSYLEQDNVRERERIRALERLSVPISLAADPDVYAQYSAIGRAMVDLVRRSDPILRDMALLKLGSVSGEMTSLANGNLVFHGTETWRSVYENILKSSDVKEYRSVAWIRSHDYWQDVPGRQSMDVNFEAAHRGVLVERIAILADRLWPKEQLLPSPPLLGWIEEQNTNGIWVMLVRESALAADPDLVADFGIYGERAVGRQEIDDHCRTLRFSLDFSPGAVRLARDRWQRLSVFAVSFRRLLDQLPPGP